MRRYGLGLMVLGSAASVFGQGEEAAPGGPVAAELLDGADLVWVMVAMALVMLMQAGFALLESGATRTKNSINVLMKNYTDMTFGSLLYWGVGYGLMFGYTSGWVGTSHFFPGIDDGVDFAVLLFQLVFAATAATIVSGAVAERTKYWSYILFTVVLTAVIYPVFGSWVWVVSTVAAVGWRRWDFTISPARRWCTRWVRGPRWWRSGRSARVWDASRKARRAIFRVTIWA